MAEDKTTLHDVSLRHFFPWLPIFRAFSIALDPKKLILAALGVLAMTSGWWLVAALFHRIGAGNQADNAHLERQVAQVMEWPWYSTELRTFGLAVEPETARVLDEATRSLSPADRTQLESRLHLPRDRAIFEQLLYRPVETLWRLATSWRFVLRPVQDLMRPFQEIFAQDVGPIPVVFAFLCGVWAVLVWAFFGGAITRIAAVQFAREERIGLTEALKFSGSKFLSFVGAPFIPLAFIAFFTLLCTLGGWIMWIPGFGPIFAGALWVLPLAAGFIMTIILIGWAVGWPLMYATVSVEGSDSFDALSRSYAYVFTRPWHYLFYVILALVFGSLCSLFVVVFVDGVVYLARWAVEWGGPNDVVRQLMYYAPPASGWQAEGVPKPTGAVQVAAWLAAFWLCVLFCLLMGFAYSYFWSASTIIYYLLRRDVDNTELQEVFLEGEGEDFDIRDGEAAGVPSGGSSPAGEPTGAETPAGTIPTSSPPDQG